MREVIDQILTGNFQYESGSLDFSCAKLELTQEIGEYCEGSFRITGPAGQYTTGVVTASDTRMELFRSRFVGPDEEIAFRFHGENMRDGESAGGEFNIVSNHGEYTIPFIVSACGRFPDSSVGSIRNLFHFSNLAKSSWAEAVNLFYSPEFERVLEGSEQSARMYYRGLSARMGCQENVDEFLVSLNKKTRIEYLVKEEEIYLENPVDKSELMINIVRNGWGVTSLQARVEGSFLSVEKNLITDEDFLGNLCRLPIYIDHTVLHAGMNYGSITLFNARNSVTVPVKVLKGMHANRRTDYRREKKSCLSKLMEFYQNFRLKKISAPDWQKETGRLVERMVSLDAGDITARLFQAQLLITGQRYHEGQWLLDHCRDMMEEQGGTQVQEAYYLYLSTLVARNVVYTADVTSRVERIYRQNPEEWRVAWLLMYLSEEYTGSISARWIFLEEQYTRGCRSPILYLEALNLLHLNPGLLRKLGDYELQVLLYGEKKDSLSVEILERVYDLAGKQKEYSWILYRVLKSSYETLENERVLREICILLIKGNKVGQQYFDWYRRGVDAELRITQLYEYYMMSLDLAKDLPIPKLVLMYFTYQNNLDYRHSAYLYCYIIKHRREHPEIYDSYYKRMLLFVREQIRRERIDPNLAILYQELVTRDMIDETLAESFLKLMFACRLRIERSDICNVIVCQPGFSQELVYPVNREELWIPVYGEGCAVFLEDRNGNRTVCAGEQAVERLMIPDKLYDIISPYMRANPCVELCLFQSGENKLTDKNIDSAVRLLELPEIAEEVRRKLTMRIMQYYREQDQERKLKKFLLTCIPERLTAGESAESIHLMVSCGMYDTAYEWLENVGTAHVDTCSLMRLISEKIERTGFAEDGKLLTFAYEIFARGKYNATLLNYLVRHYQGTEKQLHGIWKAARSFDVDTRVLSERMLIQMLYTGVFLDESRELFKEYAAAGAGSAVMKAYLTRLSYDYFVREEAVDSEIPGSICTLYKQGEQFLKVCKLAVLKYYAENQEDSVAANREVLHDFLRDMVREGVYLSCFLSYRELDPPLLLPLSDKTIIEYRAHPDARVWIHYLILRENGETGEYVTEEMTSVFGGVCCKEFVLFFGEVLQYYIVEERGGKEQLTDSGSRQKSGDCPQNQGGRYQIINDIIFSKAMQDYDTFDDKLEEYYKAEFYNRELFPLK